MGLGLLLLTGAAAAETLLITTAGADVSRFGSLYEYEFADWHAPPEMDDPGFELGAVHASASHHHRFWATHYIRRS